MSKFNSTPRAISGIAVFFLSFVLLTPVQSLAEESQERYLQSRQDELAAKQRRADELVDQVQKMQHDLDVQKKEIANSQESVMKEFNEGLDKDRKNLQGQMTQLDERRQQFEKEFEKKRKDDEQRLKQKDDEIKNLMEEMERMHTELQQDRRTLNKQIDGLKAETAPAEKEQKKKKSKEKGVSSLKSSDVMGAEDFRLRQVRPEYYLEIGDTLEIDVWRVPDLTRMATVRPDGRISLPLVGDLDVIGITLVELRDILTKRFADYVRNPQVSISIRQFGGRKFIIMGEVTSSGVYRFQQDISLLEGIALAGGFKPNAKRGKIMIIRGDIRKDPQVKIINANMENVLKRGILSENLTIQPNDIIYVSKDFIGDYREVLDNVVSPTFGGITDFFVVRSAVRSSQDHHRN